MTRDHRRRRRRLSAALVLGRGRRRIVVIDAGEPRNARAAHMQGFLSRDGTPPADLLRAARTEVHRCGVAFFTPRGARRGISGRCARIGGAASSA